jgi:methionyl-tRNA formyltransferase
LKVLYFGSDFFSIVPLEAIAGSVHELSGVVTTPDRPSGRGLELAPTPVAERSNQIGVPLFKPERLSEGELRAQFAGTGFDIGIAVAYGLVIPNWLLESAHYGFINLHPSLLPRLRGASPVQSALISGANITGVTTIQMDDGLDTGDILLHVEEPISEEDTTGTLSKRLSHLGSKLLLDTLAGLESGTVRPVPQEDEKATYAPPLSREDARIDWKRTAEQVNRLIRAMNPSPGAYSFFRGKRVKLWKALVTDVPQEDVPGTVMEMGKEGFLVNTTTTCIHVLKVQPEGKKTMSGAEFSRGQRFDIGESFTEKP